MLKIVKDLREVALDDDIGVAYQAADALEAIDSAWRKWQKNLMSIGEFDEKMEEALGPSVLTAEERLQLLKDMIGNCPDSHHVPVHMLRTLVES